MPELADPPKYCVPADEGGVVIKEYEGGLQHIMDTWKKMRSEPKKMVLAILHAVDIIAEYLSSVNIEDAAVKSKQSYNRGFTEQFFLTTSERDLKSKRPILSPEKFVYCTRTMEGVMSADELSEFNKMMFNHYRNVLINGGDEVNADVRQLCQEGMERHQPQRKKTEVIL